jgi:hypothetical protein
MHWCTLLTDDNFLPKNVFCQSFYDGAFASHRWSILLLSLPGTPSGLWQYINHFELQVTPMRELTINNEYTDPVAPIWSDAVQHALDDLKGAIFADPCLMRFNHKRLVVLRTDFLSKGFGYVVCQPGTDTASEQAMAAYQADRDFAFMTMDSSAVL